MRMLLLLVPASLILHYVSTASGQVQCFDGHGMKGNCVSLKQCPKISDLLQKGFLYDEDRQFLEQSTCKNGVGPKPHVCCAFQSETEMPKLTMSSFYTHRLSSFSVDSLTSKTKFKPRNIKPSSTKFPSPSYNTINTKPIVEDNTDDDDIDFAQRVDVYQSDYDDLDFAVRIPIGPDKSNTTSLSVRPGEKATSIQTPASTEELAMTTTDSVPLTNTVTGTVTVSALFETDVQTVTTLETSELILQTVEATTESLDPLNVTTSLMGTTITSPILETTTVEVTPENLLAERSGEEVSNITTASSSNPTEAGYSTAVSDSDFSDPSPAKLASTTSTTSSTTVTDSTYSIQPTSIGSHQPDMTAASTTIPDSTESVSVTDAKIDSTSTTPTFSSSPSTIPENESTTLSSPQTTTSSSNSIYKYANNEFLLPPDCGNHGIKERIFGGGITDLDEFPWVVLLEYGKSEKTGVRCGGVLINFRYVLTAAHCVTAQELRRQDGLKSVRIGEYDTRTDPDCIDDDCLPRVVKAGVEELIIHEKFSPMQRTDDIALLRLNKTVGKTRCSVPICMPSAAGFQGSRPGVEVVVAGWGKTQNASFSNVKRKVTLLVFNHFECRKFYAQQGQSITIHHVCAGGKANEDSCGGDSGGPLMRLLNGIWVVEGIVSFGARNCGTKGWPGIYTRARSYEPWIKFKMKP